MLQHLAHLVVRTQLIAVQPHALSHQEGVVIHAFGGLDLEPIQQLLRDQRHHLVQLLIEQLFVMMRFDRQTRQVDGGEGQVAAAVADLVFRIVHIAHHAGAAAHGRHLGFGMAGLVVLQVKGRVQEHIVREQTPRAHLAGELEQIVVGIALVIVDPFFDLEDVDRENAGFAMAQTRIGRFQNVADDHTALGAGVGTVVDAAERRLRARTGVHGVQVVHKALHRLVGVAVGALGGAATGHAGQTVRGFFIQAAGLFQLRRHGVIKRFLIGFQPRTGTHLLGGGSDGGFHRVFFVIGIQHILQRFGQLAGVRLGKGFRHAQRHTVIKVRDALTAVLVVLVGLDRDRRQRRIALHTLRLTQKAVTGRKAVLEQPHNVDLAAGGGQRIEIKIVDMDIALAMGFRLLGGEQIRFIIRFGTGGTDLEHAAHGGVAVDVGVVAFHVALARIHFGDLVDGLHQAGVRLADTGTVGAIQDVAFGGFIISGAHQFALHGILNVFDFGGRVLERFFQLRLNRVGDLGGIGSVALAARFHGFQDGSGNFGFVVQNHPTIAFDNACDHTPIPLI